METFDLQQSDAQVQAILNKMQPFAESNNLASLGFGYGMCSTAGDNPTKIVSIQNFELQKGAFVAVLFFYAFQVSENALNINGTGAKRISYHGSALPPGKVKHDTILTMVYNGSAYDVINIESYTQSGAQGAVDLALPSGVLWCEHNVGASQPHEDGLYFSWGNVTGHTGTDGYDFGTSNDGVYASTPGAALTGNIPTNGTYDAARHNMGAPWRMPTVGEFQELYNNCATEWTDEDGVAGMLFTSRNNGNTLFFPASGYRYGTSLLSRGSYGYYWSSSLYSSARGYYMYCDSGGVNPAGNNHRFRGFSVRAVQ